MRIAQLASPIESVPPKGYGGTEIVVNLLTEELVAQGHEVTLFASGDSETKARLVSVIDHAIRVDQSIPQSRWAAYEIKTLLKLKEMESQFDIIHNHMNWQALAYLDQLKTPVVTTNHNPVRDYCKDIYFAYSHLPFVSISDAYRKLNHGDKLNYVATVYNGINLDDYELANNRERKYLLFLGRLSYDKGTKESIEIAKALNLPLKIAGKVDKRDKDYFDKEVAPHLSKGQIEFVGEVNLEQKNKLYKDAIAVTYPINFDEPFGLVMAEALACGTPVMAMDRGSVREVLSDGETAIICNSVDEIIKRFPEIEKIDPAKCRERIHNLFSNTKMINSYIDVYKSLTG